MAPKAQSGAPAAGVLEQYLADDLAKAKLEPDSEQEPEPVRRRRRRLLFALLVVGILSVGGLAYWRLMQRAAVTGVRAGRVIEANTPVSADDEAAVAEAAAAEAAATEAAATEAAATEAAAAPPPMPAVGAAAAGSTAPSPAPAAGASVIAARAPSGATGTASPQSAAGVATTASPAPAPVPVSPLPTRHEDRLVCDAFASPLPALAETAGPAGASHAELKNGYDKLRAGDHPGALSAFSRATLAEPRSDVAYYWRGVAHAQSGAKVQAVVDLRLAARLNPKEPQALAYLASVALECGCDEAARRLLGRACDRGHTASCRAR